MAEGTPPRDDDGASGPATGPGPRPRPEPPVFHRFRDLPWEGDEVSEGEPAEPAEAPETDPSRKRTIEHRRPVDLYHRDRHLREELYGADGGEGDEPIRRAQAAGGVPPLVPGRDPRDGGRYGGDVFPAPGTDAAGSPAEPPAPRTDDDRPSPYFNAPAARAADGGSPRRPSRATGGPVRRPRTPADDTRSGARPSAPDTASEPGPPDPVEPSAPRPVENRPSPYFNVSAPRAEDPPRPSTGTPPTPGRRDTPRRAPGHREAPPGERPFGGPGAARAMVPGTGTAPRGPAVPGPEGAPGAVPPTGRESGGVPRVEAAASDDSTARLRVGPRDTPGNPRDAAPPVRRAAAHRARSASSESGESRGRGGILGRKRRRRGGDEASGASETARPSEATGPARAGAGPADEPVDGGPEESRGSTGPVGSTGPSDGVAEPDAPRTSGGSRGSSGSGDGEGADTPGQFDGFHGAEPPEDPNTREPSGRRRLIGAMWPPRVSRAQLVVGVLLFALGAGLAIQVRSNTESDPLRGARESDLVRVLDELEQRTERLDSEQSRLEIDRAQLESSNNAAEEARVQTDQRAQVLGILAGTVKANGPGITLTITDPKGVVTSDMLLDTLQELRAAGAEATQINQVRVVAETYFTEPVKGQIEIDGQHVAQPYVFKVIGNPQDLQPALNIPGGVIKTLERKEAQAVVVPSQQVVVDALRVPTTPDYARSAPDAGNGG